MTFLVPNPVDFPLYLSPKALCSFGFYSSTPCFLYLVFYVFLTMASVAMPFSSQFYGQALSDVFARSSLLSSGRCVHSLRLCLWPFFLSGSPLSASDPLRNDFYLFLFILLLHFLQQPSCCTLTPSLSADDHDPPIMRKQGWESWMGIPLAFCPQQADLHLYSRLHPLLQLMRKRVPLAAQDQSLLTILPPLSFLGIEPCSVDYFLTFSTSSSLCLEPIHMFMSLQSLEVPALTQGPL